MSSLAVSGIFLAVLGLLLRLLALRFDVGGLAGGASGVIFAGAALAAASAFAREPSPVDKKPSGGAPGPLSSDEVPVTIQLMFSPPDAPAWILVSGALAVALGMLLMLFGPDGTNPVTRAAAGLIFGGFAFMAGGYVAYGSGAARRNFWRGAVAVGGFLLIVGAIMTGVLMAAGAFDRPEMGRYAAAAVLALLCGIGAAYYGLKYQQGAEGLAIGKMLGFAEADGQVSGDGSYDSKGVVNGVETLIDVEQTPGGRNSRPCFTLAVLCRCPNGGGLRLSARRAGLLSMLPSGDGLQPVVNLPRWEGYVVRASDPFSVEKPLAEAALGGRIFDEEHGFEGMDLAGGNFEFRFSRDGYIDTPYVREIVDRASKLASKFH